MTDPVTQVKADVAAVAAAVKADEAKVVGFWAKQTGWLKAHPKTVVVVAVAALVGVFLVSHL